jgi:hypothetical protein
MRSPFTLAAVAGGAALIVANVLLLLDPDARSLDAATDYVTIAILVGGGVLVTSGLVAVYLRQREAFGLLGRVGFALAVAGQLLAAVVVFRVNEWTYVIALALGVVGLLLLAFAIARAPVLPQWTGLLLLVGFIGLLMVGDADLGIAFAGAVWLVIGYVLSERGGSRLRLSASAAA